MKEDYGIIVEQVLEMAGKKGPIQAEVFLLDGQDLTIDVAEQKVENMKVARERGLGLRVISQERPGYAYTSDLSTDALQRVVDKAVNNARETAADPYWGLPERVFPYTSMDLYDEKTFQVPVEEKIILAQGIEEAARSYDPRITITEKAVYHDSNYRLWIYNSYGIRGHYQGSYCGGYAVVAAQDKGESQTGLHMQYRLAYDDLEPQIIGREAGRKSIQLLGAKTIGTARMPVVLDPYPATGFLGALQTAFSADAVLKGKSFLKGKEGKIVASPLLTIIDDGTLEGRLGSSPFDGEGVPASEKHLIKNGVLGGFLHNSYTARKMGVESTGNGVRGSYKTAPDIGTSNFFIRAGQVSRDTLLGDITKGLYITDILGMHTANPISGDFSLGASGLLIEKGRFTTPVKGIAIAGNLKDILLDIDAVADDLTFFVGRGSPTIRLKSLSISGS